MKDLVLLCYSFGKKEVRLGLPRETIHHKLARDKIPELLASKNIKCIFKVLEGPEYKSALSAKLLEEVREYLFSKEEEHQLEELADILEVIQAILHYKGKSFFELETIRKKKVEERGGFYNRIFLEKTSSENEASESQSSCIFCQIPCNEREEEIIARFTHCYVIKDQFPVSKGHLLIIPYEHTENWFTSNDVVRLDIIDALGQMKIYLDANYNPDGYNIGINCGKAAGQSIMHLHLHLIPRYKGDVVAPKGGVRGVIPKKQSY